MPSGSIGDGGVPTGALAWSTGICATVILENNMAVGIPSQQGREQCLQPLGQHGSPPRESSLDCAGDGADGPASSGWTRAHARSQSRDPQDCVAARPSTKVTRRGGVPSREVAVGLARTGKGMCIARIQTTRADARILAPHGFGLAADFTLLTLPPSPRLSN